MSCMWEQPNTIVDFRAKQALHEILRKRNKHIDTITFDGTIAPIIMNNNGRQMVNVSQLKQNLKKHIAQDRIR